MQLEALESAQAANVIGQRLQLVVAEDEGVQVRQKADLGGQAAQAVAAQVEDAEAGEAAADRRGDGRDGVATEEQVAEGGQFEDLEDNT